MPRSHPGHAVDVRGTTRRFALDRAELATTGLAVVVSSTAYAVGGADYLARGVVGDLVGLGLLAGVGLVAGARVRHEALVCLAGIGAVVVPGPAWPLRLGSAAWWAVFTGGLGAYLVLRQRRLCH